MKLCTYLWNTLCSCNNDDGCTKQPMKERSGSALIMWSRDPPMMSKWLNQSAQLSHIIKSLPYLYFLYTPPGLHIQWIELKKENGIHQNNWRLCTLVGFATCNSNAKSLSSNSNIFEFTMFSKFQLSLKNWITLWEIFKMENNARAECRCCKIIIIK